MKQQNYEDYEYYGGDYSDKDMIEITDENINDLTIISIKN